MEEQLTGLLEKLTELKINQNLPVEHTLESDIVQEINLPYYLSKTGFIFDSKLTENIDDSIVNENLNIAYDKINKNCLDRCEHLYILNENEHDIKIENETKCMTNAEKISFQNSLELMDRILNGSLTNGIALVTNKLKTKENCLEINLTKHALEKFNLKRVLLINFDLNHNALVQKEFYNNSKVLVFSIHESNGLDESEFDFIGEERARGYNINLEINKKHYGNNEFMQAFFNLFLPIAYEFSPDIVIIPTCFSASKYISPSIYAHILNYLSCLADGKICMLINGDDIQEKESFSDCVLYACRALLGYPIPRIYKLNEPKQEFVESFSNTLSSTRPYWCCLQLLNESDENLSLELAVQNFKKNKKLEENRPASFSNTQIENKLSEKFETLKLDSVSPYRTCICSDDEMTKHSNLLEPNHPERPERIKRIIETLKQRDLYQRCGILKSRHATDEELKLCHDSKYIDSLKTLKSKSKDELIELSRNMDSVYYNNYTFECATLAAGCLLSVTDAVCSNEYTNGVAVCRPPGHHADCSSCSGFCFFNSIGIAARYAQKKYPSIKKVFILDFDVHHGNGTQDIFKDDNSVLFISLHRYDNGEFYPVGAESNFNCVGGDKAKGFTVNIPWNKITAGDAEYISAFLRVVMPIAYEFSPDLVLVSAGFDAAVGDPLGRYNITPNGYSQMIKILSTLSNGKIILGLEGGYNLTSISESMASCVSMLLGDPCPSMTSMIAHYKAYESIKNVIGVQKNYWNCFKFDQILPTCNFVKKFQQKKNNNNNSINKSIEMPCILRDRLRSRNRSNLSSDSLDSAKSTPRKQNQSVDSLDSSTGSFCTPIKNSAKKKTNKKIEILKDNLIIQLDNDSTNNSSTPKKPLEELEKICLTLSVDNVVPYAVIPLPFCPHLLEINTKPNKDQINAAESCNKCNDSKENWTCLTCYTCLCSRFVKGHMSEHFEETKHPMVLSYSDMSIWCYECDSYVDNEMLYEIKQLACDSKFS